jgi:endonuclease YncB( thermonuclease family)
MKKLIISIYVGLSLLGCATNEHLPNPKVGIYDRAPDLKSTRIEVVGDNVFLVNNTYINLYGITPIHYSQKCLDSDSKTYSCGFEYFKKLRYFLSRAKYVRCYFENEFQPTYIGNGTHVPMTCFVNGFNLNEYIVSEGYALTFIDAYKNIESLARRNKLGVWRGKFMEPKVYLQYSANGVDANDQFLKGNHSFTYPESESMCDIKAVNRGDERLYLKPGDHFYNLVEIKSLTGDQLLCSEQEALEQGYRRKM